MEDTVRALPSFHTPGPAAVVAAVRDTHTLTDEEQARRAREQYRERGIPSVEPDDVISPHLEAEERLLGRRAQATVGRIDDSTRAAVHDGGPLYVTTARLLHVGHEVTSVSLAEISDVAMADDRILVTISGGRGLMLDVSEPRQFRVLLAAARTALRP
jgi:hypothetical protein